MSYEYKVELRCVEDVTGDPELETVPWGREDELRPKNG